MNDIKIASLNIGLYGATHAGKTRFLYELLRRWVNENKVAGLSDSAHRFLETVEDEIKTYQRSSPTTARSEEMHVEVSADDEVRPMKITFRDLRGEMLSREMDDLSAVAGTGDIPRQVGGCNAFLFFFDPSSVENRSNIAEHHRKELERADHFIKYVLGTRQNHHLPVIFVLTHMDTWESDKDIRSKAATWVQECNECLRGHYRAHLGAHYPPSLADPKKTAIPISNLRPGHQEQVIAKLRTLATQAQTFRGADKTRVTCAVLAMVATMVFLCIAGAIIAYFSKGAGANMDWAAEELDSRIATLSTEPHKETSEEAAKVNRSLLLLGDYIAKKPTDKKASDSFNNGCSFVKRRLEQLEPLDLHTKLSVIAAYLIDTEELEARAIELKHARLRVWSLQREKIVADVRRLCADPAHKRGYDQSASLANVKQLKDLIESLSESIRSCTVTCSGDEKATFAFTPVAI